ncbi:SH3 domain-binding protein 4-like [Gadus chalcogrammus]|uniref:SH3 domain-binding protein 4-like n=1 Tax=Gadus chalcogrammus TaxID=1042646 RepID=UPI0024C3F928|nr:SH3 domain-binding protein 4-like [Gadus chalcogrammus]
MLGDGEAEETVNIGVRYKPRLRAANGNAGPRGLSMASNRIVLLRCRSEVAPGDPRPGVTEGSGVRGHTPGTGASPGGWSPEPPQEEVGAVGDPPQEGEVVAVRDHLPGSFAALGFSAGERLVVLDASGPDWWYAHNQREMGFIPAASVRPLGPADRPGGGRDAGVPGERTGVTLTPVAPDTCLPGGGAGPGRSGRSLRGPTDLMVFETSPPLPSGPRPVSGEGGPQGVRSPDVCSASPPSGPRDPPSLRGRRSRSLSELSSPGPPPPGPSPGHAPLRAPAPEQFQSRDSFRAAWLSHRRLARSCHALDSLGGGGPGGGPGWGQTQPVEASVVCRLDHRGGVVQLPDTHISVLVPEGQVGPGASQQVSLRALLDPPPALSSELCSTVSPLLELRLSHTEAPSFLTLEGRVAVALRRDGGPEARLLCVRSPLREGPYAAVPGTYLYRDTVQVQLDRLQPLMYLALVVQAAPPPAGAPSGGPGPSVWEQVLKKMTLGLYGPKHLHPSFRAVTALFGHDCTPQTLLVGGGAAVLHLWGKHQFVLGAPQDLRVALYSNTPGYEVGAGEGLIPGVAVLLGGPGRLVHTLTARGPGRGAAFTLRVQVRDPLDAVLAQFCVQTPPPPPLSAGAGAGPRRFLKRAEVERILLSPLAVPSKPPGFQDRRLTNLRFGRLTKTVSRRPRDPYLLEYRRGDAVALLSEERVRLRGRRRTKDWYVGWSRGRLGLVHAANVRPLGRVRPPGWEGPDVTTAALLEQGVAPCRRLTYVYASLRTLLMEQVGGWRAFADALGYGGRPLAFFCWAAPDTEPERVASVLGRLKEDCSGAGSPGRRCFQRELFMALLKLDLQGLVLRLLQDQALLTAAVELGPLWRELAPRLAHVSPRQMDAYEAPHRDRSGLLDHQSMWRPAYDFLLTWAAAVGDCCRDVLQELQLGLDRMRGPAPRRWRHLTGVLLLVHALEPLRAAAFCPRPTHPDTPI